MNFLREWERNLSKKHSNIPDPQQIQKWMTDLKHSTSDRPIETDDAGIQTNYMVLIENYVFAF